MIAKYRFCAKLVKEYLIDATKNWFEDNGKGCTAVVGISGGKDSTVAAAICVAALGAENVLGVLMPNGEQKDIGDAKRVCEHLGIKYTIINIRDPYLFTLGRIKHALLREGIEHNRNGVYLSQDTEINLAPRLRMATLYAVAQSLPNGGRVINTCNLSEDWVGYATIYGDAAGDFGILQNLTVQEVIAVGRELGLPEDLLVKTPSDGLCGQSDEDKLGFSYATLDKYLRENIIDDEDVRKNIDSRHQKNLFKLKPMAKIEVPYELFYTLKG